MKQPDELLKLLSEGAASRPAWQEFVAYCNQRERGLRQDALLHLHAFIEQAKGWDDSAQREFVSWLFDMLEQHAGYHDQLPSPLAMQLLMPALHAWIEADPGDPRPHRWLAMFFREELYRTNDYTRVNDPVDAHLRAAIAADPAEQPSRIELVVKLIGTIDFATHHLPGGYIGEPELALATADEATTISEQIIDPETRRDLQARIEYYRQLVLDWQEFTASGENDFAAWTQARGRDYAWIPAYNFGERPS